MIFVQDNFFEKNELNDVIKLVKKMKFRTCEEELASGRVEAKYFYNEKEWIAKFPGIRTIQLGDVNPILDGFIVRKIENLGLPCTRKPFKFVQTGNLRLEKDNEEDYIHQDGVDWAYLIYLSKTNLDSGTKFYLSDNEDEEHAFVRFIQNRIVIFNGDVWHSPAKNYGKSFEDGRLTINGFCTWDR